MEPIDAEGLKRQARARAFEAVWAATLGRLQKAADEGADSEVELSYELNPPPFGAAEDFVVFDWSMAEKKRPTGVLRWKRDGRLVQLADAPLDVRARIVNAADQIINEHRRYVQWLQQEVDKALRAKPREG